VLGTVQFLAGHGGTTQEPWGVPGRPVEATAASCVIIEPVEGVALLKTVSFTPVE
jgi:hypothetical protein